MSRLGQSQIVEAALELLDRDGLAGVTTRRLAATLGIKSASLYWHVRDREELLDLLSDRIVADAHWPAQTSGWRTRVEGLMTEYVRCLLAHRDAARVTAGRSPKGPNRLRVAEMLLSALLAAGLTDVDAIDAALVLTTYVVGFALEHQAAEAASRPVGSIDDAFSETYPTLSRLAYQMVPGTGPGRFHEGLKLVLDGVQASAKRS